VIVKEKMKDGAKKKLPRAKNTRLLGLDRAADAVDCTPNPIARPSNPA